MIKFLLILMLNTPGHMAIIAEVEFVSFRQCERVGHITSHARDGWTYICSPRVYV